MKYLYKRILLLAAGLLLLPTESQAQRAATAGDGAQFTGSVARGGDVLRYYDPETDIQQVPTADPGGFVFGTNGYFDDGKASCYDLPDGQSEITVTQVDGYMVRAFEHTLETYDLVIYSGTVGFDVDEAGPETELYRETFDVADIVPTSETDEPPFEATEHMLATPYTVDGSFCVSFEWDNTQADIEDLGFAATEERTEPSPYEWELWGDGSWHNVSDAWGFVAYNMWMDVYYAGSVSNEDGAQAQAVRLGKAFPNPFATSTQVEVEVDEAQRVTVEAFDVLGRRVATLFDGMAAAGSQTLTLEAADLPAGLYIVQMRGENFAQSRKVVLSR